MPFQFKKLSSAESQPPKDPEPTPEPEPEPEKTSTGVTLDFDDISEMLAHFGKAGKTEKPPRRTKARTSTPKQPEEKTFIAFHFHGRYDDNFISKRDGAIPVFINFFTRSGDTFAKVLIDAKEDKKFHPNYMVVAHDHSFNEPCVPNDKGKCREIPSA